jgi:hypothetical protein
MCTPREYASRISLSFVWKNDTKHKYENPPGHLFLPKLIEWSVNEQECPAFYVALSGRQERHARETVIDLICSLFFVYIFYRSTECVFGLCLPSSCYQSVVSL